MTINTPYKREKIHNRNVHCEGFLREDGLWDIEGHLKDTKTYSFKSDHRGNVKAGTAIHDMTIRLTLNDNLKILDVITIMDNYPYSICPEVIPNFKSLIGLTIGRGFRKNVYLKVGGTKGCTHLVELLFPIATTAFQTVYSYNSNKKIDTSKAPSLINSCYSWNENNEVIKQYFPNFYVKKNK